MVIAATWRRYLLSPPPLIGWVLTIGFFIGTGAFFRAPSLDAVWNVYQGLAAIPTNFHPQGRNTLILAMFCAIVLPPSHEIVRRLTEIPRMQVALGLAAAACLVLVALGNRENYQFVYFQF